MSLNVHVEVDRIATKQRGYITRRQPIALGYTASMVRTRLMSGDWRSMSPGIYLLSGHRPTVEGRLAVACAALGAVVSHESAAQLHELGYVRRDLVVVTVAVRRTHSFDATIVHQSTDLTSDDIVDMSGLPTTSVARTIRDLAATVSSARMDRIVEHALANRRCTLDAIRDQHRRLARRGKPGTATLRQLLERLDPDHIPTESELEFRVVELFRRLGLPEPARQHPLPWRSERAGRVDFAFPSRRLIVEADGRAWHTTAEAFDDDRMRDNLAQLAGWRVVRLTWDMLHRRVAEVERLLTEVMT